MGLIICGQAGGRLVAGISGVTAGHGFYVADATNTSKGLAGQQPWPCY